MDSYNVKVKAWQFRIKHNLSELPQDLLSLNQKVLGFKILSYEEGWKYIQTLQLEEYAASKLGFTTKVDDMISVFFSDNLSSLDRDVVIAHEIGHIVCNHVVHNFILGYSDNANIQNKQEQEANDFALAFLAHTPILLEIGVHTSSEISKITGLNNSLSEKVALELFHEANNKKTNIEIELIDTFYRTIKRLSKKDNIENMSYLQTNKYKLICISSILCCILFVSITLFTLKIRNQNTLPLEKLQDKNIEINQLPTTTEQSDDFMVYVSSEATRYHLENCRYLKNKTNVSSITIAEAKKIKLEPCLVCKPNIKKE